jgi:hypothetical protein
MTAAAAGEAAEEAAPRDDAMAVGYPTPPGTRLRYAGTVPSDDADEVGVVGGGGAGLLMMVSVMSTWLRSI